VQTSQAFAGEDYEKPTTTSITFAKGEVSFQDLVGCLLDFFIPCGIIAMCE